MRTQSLVLDLEIGLARSTDNEVEAWFKAQADLTDRLLAKIPARDEPVKEWTALDKLNPATYSCIRYQNGRVFYKKTLGGENVGKRGVKYPAVMGVAGWNDPRIPPWQPGKFVAALQSASASPNPVLMMVNYDSGHFTEEKVVTFRDFANQMAFLLWQTGHKDFQPVK